MTDQPQLPLLDRPESPAPSRPAIRARRARPVRPVPGGDWRIDERTRVVGRRGLAAARAALARSVEALEPREPHAA